MSEDSGWTLPSGGDMVALWLVRWTQGQEICICHLAGSMCFVLVQNTFLSQYPSPPRSINGWQKLVREAWWSAREGRGAGGSFNHGMNRHLIQRGGLLLPVTPCEETRIRSPGPGWATTQIQTLPNYLQPLSLNKLNCNCNKLYELATQRCWHLSNLSQSIANVFYKSWNVL